MDNATKNNPWTRVVNSRRQMVVERVGAARLGFCGRPAVRRALDSYRSAQRQRRLDVRSAALWMDA